MLSNQMHNNRKGAHAMMIGLVGVLLDNNDFKNSAKWFIQNAIANQVFPDGTTGEFHRNTTSHPSYGWQYSAACAFHYQMVADAFYRAGDPSLYEFVTDEGYGYAGNQGSIVVSNAQKSILTAGKGLVKYTNSDHVDGVRYNNTTVTEKDFDIIQGYYENRPTDGKSWYGVHETWFVQMNQYYKDPLIEQAYKRQLNLGYPSNPSSGSYSYMGNGKTMPDMLFMFYELEY